MVNYEQVRECSRITGLPISDVAAIEGAAAIDRLASAVEKIAATFEVIADFIRKAQEEEARS